MRQKSLRKRNSPQRLPEHIGAGFLRELRALVDHIGQTQGFRGSYLAEQCFSKYCDSGTTAPEVRRAAAIEKWLATEKRNTETNQRLFVCDADLSPGLDRVLGTARKLVSDVLGPLRYPAILWDGEHTNGASTRVRRSPKAAMDKLTGIAHVSASALPHWREAVRGTQLEDQLVEITDHSVMFTVPKSTDIDRVACKEPEINMYLQRSVGNHIRRRLRSFGIDLNDQSKNQSLAREAVRRNLATIDLSSASDSISRQLVINLLPFEWWSLLDDLRVDSTLIDGQLHDLEMFSSMGNGFTFELESLLFWAITRAVCWRSGVKGTISVYGDDIIAPCAIVPRLKRWFDYLGFKMNEQKTSWRGLFRESCGGHYYGTVDVTPFYVRGPVFRTTDLIKTLNQICKWDSHGWGFMTSPEIIEFHQRWAKHVPGYLHGGQDLDEIEALVTGDPPRKRLRRRRRPVEYDSWAGALLWFDRRGLPQMPRASDIEFNLNDPRTYGIAFGEAITPMREGRYDVVPQPDWTERTTVTPYLLAEV